MLRSQDELNTMLNVTLIKPRVNTNTFDVKLSVKSSDNWWV